MSPLERWFRTPWRAFTVAAVVASIASFPFLLRGFPALAATGTIRSSGAPELVIYSNDFALVREPKSLSLSQGAGEVTLEGMPQRVDSSSVRLEGAGFRVRRQSYRFDTWNTDRAIRRFLGDSIAYRYGGRRYLGVLAGIDGDDVFIQRRDSADVLMMLKRQQLTEVEFPARFRLRTRPTMEWHLDAEKAGERAATLSYLTSGISWSAEYVAVLAPDEKSVEWTGWALVENRSGASFKDAKVSLVAGEMLRDGEAPDRGVATEPSAGEGPRKTDSDFFAYHAYALPGAVTLDNFGTLNAAIVPATRVAAARSYRYDGARDGSKVRVQLELGGEKGGAFATPLPEGRVRVYASSAVTGQSLVGQDRIQHTAPGERVRVQSGVAFDLVGERTRTAHTRVSRNVTEDAYRIRIRNRGDEAAVVTVVESLYGNWEIAQKSVDVKRRTGDGVEFELKVPPGKESELTYTVRYSF
ncbi:MAG TPA: DUF4139 domain-containing protein [Candidatus Eisenbacteria bacterium]|nr:DUF4139 domain-containing protein [Candidatus Eisenbacteria bacterium]